MDQRIQTIADAPTHDRPIYRKASALARHAIRTAIYRTPLRKWLTPKDPLHDAARWDHLLGRTNFATYLGGTIEIELRNAMVAALVRSHCQPRRVLDAGCAGGTLSQQFNDIERYLGIDISSVAIAKARQFETDAVKFKVSELQQFELRGPWDAVVINEVLYYLPFTEAIAQVDRYCGALSDNGIMVISMKAEPKARAIFSEIAKRHRWSRGVLWQAKDSAPDYKTRINQQRPAFLIAAIAPRPSA